MFSRELLRVVFSSLLSSGFPFHLVLCSITLTLSRLKSFTVGREWGAGVAVAFCRSMAILIRNLHANGKQMKALGTCFTWIRLCPHLPCPMCWCSTISAGFGKWSQGTSDVNRCLVCWTIRNVFFSLLFSFFWNERWVGNPAMLVSNSRPDRITGI